jgi:integrase
MKGYVFQNKRGDWVARFTYTDQNEQRRYVKRRATVNTEAGARQTLLELIDEFDNSAGPKITSLSQLCDYYEKHYCVAAEFVDGQKIVGLKDYKKVRGFLQLYRDHFKALKLKDLNYEHIKQFRLTRLRTPTKKGKQAGQRTITTVNRELTWLRRILNIAAQKEWISKNPFHCGDSLISAAAEKRRERILTLEEQEKLLAACEGRRRHLRLPILFLLYTGLRHREMLTLRWENVDLENGVFVIKAQYSKTEKERIVGIPSRILKELKTLPVKEGKVFKYKAYINKTFDVIRKEVGLPDVRVHDLRHTFTTRAAKKVELAQLANVLGHSQIETTYRYVNNDMEMAKRVAAAVED